MPASIACGKPLQNSLDPDQAQQNVGPDLDQSCLTWKDFSDYIGPDLDQSCLALEGVLKKVFEKIHVWQKSMQNYPVCKESNKIGMWKIVDGKTYHSPILHYKMHFIFHFHQVSLGGSHENFWLCDIQTAKLQTRLHTHTVIRTFATRSLEVLLLNLIHAKFQTFDTTLLAVK